MKKIIITKRSNDWHACIDGAPEYWGCGKSPAEAVGGIRYARIGVCIMNDLFELVQQCGYRSSCWRKKDQRYWTRKRRIDHARRMRKAAKLEREVAVAIVEAFQEKFPMFGRIMSTLHSPLPYICLTP